MPFTEFKNKFPATVSALLSAKKSGRLSHAYLLQGDNSDTLQAFARRLAQLSACMTPYDESDSCGRCKICKQIELGSYPDMAILEPLSKSRRILIGKDSDDPDTLREFQSFFHLSASIENGKKIGIIFDAERMTEDAQNAFLKTLEEPPGNSIFILCSSNPRMLLPTIISRCQRLLLIENICSYSFPDSDSLLILLKAMTFGEERDLKAAEEHASSILAISEKLKLSAEEKVKSRYETQRKILVENSDISAIRRLEEKIEAEIQAEYLMLRSAFLSMLHSWFAQLYMRACGVPSESIPNPELFFPLKGKKFPLNEKKAYKNLIFVEALLDNLKWNIDDELAIREFCIRIALEQ
ncbi:MAG: hypothetical protein QXH80_00690 [Candidatus Nanoarchaeia archaeon]